ncbi:MAG: hypothetical protein EZS28_032401 [Streblomastix strix]|uniref:Protein kinase domain-containing protein n=1 Tax=Streblomastix strix TaxID=222440 RepID=A0A5J4UP02_9EUKA|nr:MAG: hypothetical protein EZS28_032401 [Streblomastix strix]
MLYPNRNTNITNEIAKDVIYFASLKHITFLSAHHIDVCEIVTPALLIIVSAKQSNDVIAVVIAVYLVFKEDIGIVASKVMREEEFDTTEQKARLSQKRESLIPFQLKYHSATMDGNNVVIVMEYANCGNLQFLIDKNIDIPVPIIRVIIKQLLEGLHLMHEKGLIHRDIKAENVMLLFPQGSGRMLQRDQCESDLTFFGFHVLENRLRPTTKPAIKRLQDVGIRCVMVTGDNVLTAVNIARQCNIIPTQKHVKPINEKEIKTE